MKRALIIASALALAALGYFWIAPAPIQETAALAPAKAPPPAQPPEEKITLHTNEDATEVFRRAFWRDPTSNDRILHAERREWVSKENGVRRWQWFIAVEPCVALTTWLRDSNPFSLRKVEQLPSLGGFASPPAWFPAAHELAGSEIRQSLDKTMTVIFNPKLNILHATSDGCGFATPERRQATALSVAVGNPDMQPRQWQPRRQPPQTVVQTAQRHETAGTGPVGQ